MSTSTSRTALSKRALTVVAVPTSSSTAPLHSRHLKRVHVAAELMRAAKICAGDTVIVRGMDEVDELERLSLDDSEVKPPKEQRFAVGIAWPSFTLSGTSKLCLFICYDSSAELRSLQVLPCRHCFSQTLPFR
jgi:hypothetical protein